MPAASVHDDEVAVPGTGQSKPTVYILDTWNPQALAHAKTTFNVIIPSDRVLLNGAKMPPLFSSGVPLYNINL
ncbi:D-3-phosphoglycerate dehydrogenase [Penicillium capsulatum]|uniref:D-3-phosphoglycerate dehydrogenase n=1 Tax=Penicillium capsulatum TaxID=69766 RepID=A0A9W9IQ77_9EURO|nr:D-3-phosphoglycerate dehydrogenase [Penicillium capsulatum]KAJ6130161.1 D-3-phosphoglycerate dehydrogenase [Penicillium capsulatum]